MSFVVLSVGKPWARDSGRGTDAGMDAGSGGAKAKKAPPKNRASAKGAAVCPYPLFEKAAENSIDPYWIAILRDMSMGKFPRSFRYINGILTYKVRGKPQERHITQTDPKQAHNDVIEFMQAVGIFSSIDNETKSVEMKQRVMQMTEVKINSWSQVRAAPHKKVLIGHYVQDITKQLKLTSLQARELESKIHLGLLTGHFNNLTIHVDDGFITSIDGLVREESGSFGLDPAYAVKIKRPKGKRMSVDDENLFNEVGSMDTDADGADSTFATASVPNTSFYKSWIKFLTHADKRSTRRSDFPIPASAPSTPSMQPSSAL